eukprot:6212075-Pleurochrysis_carterae.AAC.1
MRMRVRVQARALRLARGAQRHGRSVSGREGSAELRVAPRIEQRRARRGGERPAQTRRGGGDGG